MPHGSVPTAGILVTDLHTFPGTDAWLPRNSSGPYHAPAQKQLQIMKKYVCDICGYVYDPQQGDPDSGIAPGTPFEEIPDDWVCPLCGVGKDQFSPMD